MNAVRHAKGFQRSIFATSLSTFQFKFLPFVVALTCTLATHCIESTHFYSLSQSFSKDWYIRADCMQNEPSGATICQQWKRCLYRTEPLFWIENSWIMYRCEGLFGRRVVHFRCRMARFSAPSNRASRIATQFSLRRVRGFLFTFALGFWWRK